MFLFCSFGVKMGFFGLCTVVRAKSGLPPEPTRICAASRQSERK
jgi:hypothetical protein